MANPEAASALENTGEEVATILVAVDQSAGASRVVSAAARFARAAPIAAVHIAHVFRSHASDRARAGAPAIDTNAIEDAKEYLAGYVRAATRQCRNAVSGHFLIGDPTAEVLKLSESLKADLLVIGTHDYTGFERFLLGSIAETLMRKVHCSTLVVRPPPQRK